jgi:HAD superfamily hydrolase (TIGR01509 family)
MTSEPWQLIRDARCILLDFDGPVCDLYAGHPASIAAQHVRDAITATGVQMPEHIQRTSDPLEIFTWTATISPGLAEAAEAEMTRQELAAITTARPTPYVHDLVTSARDSGRAIAIVSNNAAQAVRGYLERHGLDDRIDTIAARTSPDPRLLKPSPHLIRQAITQLATEPGQCILVGDQPSDIHAATQAGTPAIGYASRPGRHNELANSGTAVIVTSLADLVLPLRAQPLPN